MITQTATRRTIAAAMALAGAFAISACSSSNSSSTPSGSAIPSASVDAELAAMVPADIKSTGKLTFGTDASYAPMEFLASDGSTIEGVDVDLGKAIASKLGLTGEFTNSNFDAIIVGVQKGKFNSAMSSLTINPDRVKQVDMISYFSAGTSWATQKGNPKGVDPANPCGKTVAVQKATVQVDDITARSKACTDAGKPAINIEQFNLQTDASSAVVTTKADAMLADSPVVSYAITQTGKLEQVGDIYDSAPYGIIVPKGQTEYAKAIQGAVDGIIKDGTYKAILDKWNVANGAITASEINPSK